MSGILEGLTVVEGSAFVAAPLGGMTLAQLGADVIRFDDLHGGLDHTRWPLAADGQSLFWAGMNKGKRSLSVDLRSPAGRELVSDLIAKAGAFLTNFPARGWLAYEKLKARREDLIMVHLKGNRDGTSEVDYTVNPATGFPWATGPRNLTEPLNSVLPAWDIAMGELAAVGLLAADRHRERHGEGQLVEVALSDVAFAVVGHLGRVAQAELHARDYPRRDGNYLYGAFGHDFVTRDERHVMVVALTNRQWESLLTVTDTHQQMAKINEATGVDLDTESGRFEDRDLIAAILRPWFQARDLSDIRAAFTGTGVSWGPYQTFSQLVGEDPRLATEMWEQVQHPGVGSYLMPGTPLDFSAVPRTPLRRAPQLGEHTEEVLSDVLGLSATEVARLRRDAVISAATSATVDP
jgi:2-methylfumaryl-CoA isomerase